MRELERRFPPEFRNRIDEVVLFAPLDARRGARDREALPAAGDGSRSAQGRQDDQVDDDALELVVTKGYNMAFGARFLKRLHRRADQAADQRAWKEGSHFDVSAKDGAGRRRAGAREDRASERSRPGLRRRRMTTDRSRRLLPARNRPVRLRWQPRPGASSRASRLLDAVAILQRRAPSPALPSDSSPARVLLRVELLVRAAPSTGIRARGIS